MIEISNESIWLNQSFDSWEQALNKIGEILREAGYITKEYIASMIDRQKLASVYIGNFVALPHALAKDEHIIKENIFLFQVPDGVDFGAEEEEREVATILFVVVLKEKHQLENLQELAFLCSDVDQVMALSDAQTVDEIQIILKKAADF
ncbi:hypothetical protein A5844_001960 [Enterococcus sp. 10A9_DIV0425]|uniref:Mannitol-specific phosphotransferase enzyme IIA component n=1 Tax=Candidatus Enterococcus wittei TaxID=1987383 RepID=A0A242JZA8_9ENTE|nr:PTS sugar transporter subunit IIA [Enterococcus sp. 10A9_DIV0425]OTP10261.1 hypothetical protein A5844_001960 [Enterococcus sp. 10A9_DIV0425]THE10229.1 PTS mannitol transporter subunit IIA [Enterococcus hirae]